MNDYGADLARIHDEGYGDLARHTEPAIVGHLRSAGIRRGVVDLGCGSGILARHLLESGYDVLGVDSSPAMLQIARRMAPAATFVRRRAEDIELPRCVAIVATGEAITYVGARTAPTAHVRRHIRRVSLALARGGLFIFDAIVEDATAPMKYGTWRATRASRKSPRMCVGTPCEDGLPRSCAPDRRPGDRTRIIVSACIPARVC